MHLLNLIPHILLSLSFFHSLVLGEPFDQTRPPALVLRVTRDGLDTVAQAVEYILPKMAVSVTLPDFSLPTMSGVKVDIKNMAVKNFSEPKIKYTLISPNKVNIEVSAGPVDVTADWSAEKSVFLLWKQSDKGRLHFHMDSFSATLVGEIGPQHPNGLPSLSLPTCSSSLGRAYVKILDAKEKFFIDMLELASIAVRRVVPGIVCSQIQKIVGTTVNQKIKAIPDLLNSNFGIGLRYYIIPTIDSDYVELVVKAVLVKDLPCDTCHSTHVTNSISTQMTTTHKST